VETRVLKSSFSGIKGAKKERKMLEKSSTSYLGPGCREFESRHSDQKSRIRLCGIWTFLFVWSETRTIKCDCPVDSRLPTARRRQHLYFLPSGKKMQTSLATRTKSPESACAESGLFCLYGARLEQLNATRMSAAGEGLTEPILYLRLRRRCKRVSPLGP